DGRGGKTPRMTCTCVVPPWPSLLPNEPVESTDRLGRTLGGANLTGASLVGITFTSSALVGAIHGGEAANVIPQNVTMRLTVRAFNPDIRAMLKQRITDLVQSQAQTLGVQADVDYDWRYPSLINDEASTAFAKQVALDWLGDKGVMPNLAPLTGSEDFSFMLQECPGCYLIVGNGQGEHHHTGGCMVHNPGYDFNDAILPIAASYWVQLVNAFLKAA
ncbi:MAG: M20/M25/M40 family metallo-hydrolase, partial [Betaproteobacteria bacterium]|nr:M20/M25/M40 family metallo-hydrolase [Betaproteobacteria bacterium]